MFQAEGVCRGIEWHKKGRRQLLGLGYCLLMSLRFSGAFTAQTAAAVACQACDCSSLLRSSSYPVRKPVATIRSPQAPIE